MIEADHVIAPVFLNDFLSIVAATVVHVHGLFDWVFSLAQVLRILLQIRSDQTRSDQTRQSQ
jgi:hypothetical protein